MDAAGTASQYDRWDPSNRSWRSKLKQSAPRSLWVSRLHASAGHSLLLTFDDGPNPEVTPRVLDELDAFGARAVFFVIGRRARRAASVVRDIVRRGHVIGNHSHLHRPSYVYGPGPGLCSYLADCRRCQDVVENCAGRRPTLFRAPGGRISGTTLLTPHLLGLQSVGWSLEVGDWRFSTAQDATNGAARLLKYAAPRDIVLLHDNNPQIVQLLRTLLPGLAANGFDLKSGSDYVGRPQGGAIRNRNAL